MLLTPQFVRQEANKEEIINMDFAYITEKIETWWLNRNQAMSNHFLKLELIALLLKELDPEHSKYADKLARNYIAGFCITKVFSSDDYLLALIIHEALCELFHLNDTKYAYEEHKALFLKPKGENYRDWGNGYGIITPHSDDLYEENAVDFLALTVCRDLTKTPTICYFPKELLKFLNDDELFKIIHMKARFISGKNINILKEKESHLIEYDTETGLNFHLDFRIDNHTGERMVAVNPKEQCLIDKMRECIPHCAYLSSVPETGTFFIVANYKTLHARSAMNIDRLAAKSAAYEANFHNTPRLLYRSKGPRYNISL